MDIGPTKPSIDSTDPNWNLFLHQLQAENQRQKFTEQVREIDDYLCLLFHSSSAFYVKDLISIPVGFNSKICCTNSMF